MFAEGMKMNIGAFVNFLGMSRKKGVTNGLYSNMLLQLLRNTFCRGNQVRDLHPQSPPQDVFDVCEN